MSRDYAKKTNTRRRKKRQPAPLWAWIVMAILLALLVSLLIYLWNQSQASQAETVNTVKSAPKKTQKPEGVPQPRFDFYEILKEQNLEVPDRSAEVEAAVSKQVDYYLQVASFRKESDADALRAELLLLNLEANIETVTKNQQTWYRIVVGPFTSRSKMAKARSTLASMELNALLLKR